MRCRKKRLKVDRSYDVPDVSSAKRKRWSSQVGEEFILAPGIQSNNFLTKLFVVYSVDLVEVVLKEI